MTDLVLHAPTIDARAAAELVRQRYPNVDTRCVSSWDDYDGSGNVAWSLGLGDNPDVAYLTVISSTPDASVAMQVWWELNSCPDCEGLGEVETGGKSWCACPDCDGLGFASPPRWLTILDKVTRGVELCDDDAAYWAHMETTKPRTWVRGYSNDDPTLAIWAGKAILRDRKQR